MRIVVHLGYAGLHHLSNALTALSGGDAHTALARAVNRLADIVHGRVIRVVGKHYSILRGMVVKTVRKRKGKPDGGGTLEGEVWATGKPLPLKDFKPKQFRPCVKAEVWGQMQFFPQHFIYVGNFSHKRVGKVHDHVFHRITAARKPIEKT